ncbi:MAG: DMT family transporter [Actinomycetes bacterium]
MGTARVLGPDLPAAPLGAMRLVVAAAGLLLVVRLTGPGRAGLPRALRRPAAVVAGVGMAGFQVTFLGAVVVAGVAVGTLVAIGSVPLFTAAATRVVSRTWVVATSTAVVGLTLLVLGGDESGPLRLPGVLLALGAGASYSTYVVASKSRVTAGEPPDLVAASAFTWAALLLAPALLLGDPSEMAAPGALATAAYLGLVPTALAYLLLNRGLSRLPASTVGTLGLAEPVVATCLGVLVLGERLTPAATAGAALVLAALALLARATAQDGRPRTRDSAS